MTLTKIDRMEHIEDIIQKHIEMKEKQMESLGTMTDPEICRIRNMYLLDLGELRRNLISIRHKIELEYATKKTREEYHDQIKSFVESCNVGGQYAQDLRRRRVQGYPPRAGNGGAVSHVGRDGGYFPDDGQGKRR